jgi:hypothetical protein
VDEASALLKQELYDPAAQRLLDAAGFRESPGDLTAPLAEALKGVGDDNYRARNFPQAMAAYGQYLRVVPAAVDDIRQRWLQCLVETLTARPHGARLSQDAWLTLMAQAGPILQARPNELLGRVLAGMALEDTSDSVAPAMEEYAVAVGRPAGQGAGQSASMAEFLAARQAAFERARRQFEFPADFERDGVWATVLEGEPRAIEGEGFVVRHRNAFAGQQVAAAVAYHLPRLADHLGVDRAALPVMTVNLHGDRQSYRRDEQAGVGEPALTRLRYVDGRLSEVEIGLYQRDPALLSATLPHELTHVLLAAALRRQILPAAVEEGLALHSELAYRHTQMRRIMRQLFVDSAGQVDTPDLAVLLSHRTAPKEDALRFYAASYAWVSFLAGAGPVSKVIVTARAAGDASDMKAWAGAYGVADAAALQRAFAADFRAMVGRAVTVAP